MKKAEILGVKMGDNTEYEGFGFMSYYYLHGEAESINGYDLVEGDMEAMRKALSSRIFPVNLKLQDGNTYDAIVISYYKFNRMTGLICLCTDLEHIKHALFEYDNDCYKDTVIEETEKKWLYENYPGIREIVKEYNLNNN